MILLLLPLLIVGITIRSYIINGNSTLYIRQIEIEKEDSLWWFIFYLDIKKGANWISTYNKGTRKKIKMYLST